MSRKQKIVQARIFINRERVYMLMLSFILIFNAWLGFAERMPAMKKNFIGKRTAYFAAAEKDRKQNQLSYPRLVNDRQQSWEQFWTAKKQQKHIRIAVSFFGLAFVAAFLMGLLLDVRILQAKIKGKGIVNPYPGTENNVRHVRVRWKVWDIFKLLIIFLFFGYILHIVEMELFFAYLSKIKLDITNLFTFVSIVDTAVMDLAILGVILYFVRVKYKQRFSAIGLKMKDAGRHIYWALLCYIAILPPLVFILLLLMWICKILNYQPPPQPLINLFLEEKNIWTLVFSAFIIVFIGPLVEEVFFRGFAYNAIKKKWGVKQAIVVTAVVFAAMHGLGFGLLPIMILGLLLAYSYEKTGSLIPAVTIHILHNGIMVLLLLLGRALVV